MTWDPVPMTTASPVERMTAPSDSPELYPRVAAPSTTAELAICGTPSGRASTTATLDGLALIARERIRVGQPENSRPEGIAPRPLSHQPGHSVGRRARCGGGTSGRSGGWPP